MAGRNRQTAVIMRTIRKSRRRRLRSVPFSVLISLSLMLGSVLGVVFSQPVWASTEIDMGEEVLECRVTQRGSSDCAVASMATVEAYFQDLTGDSQAAYNAIWNKNGQQAYIQSWGNLGYRTYSLSTDFGGDVDAFCERMYQELEKGTPCLVRRNSVPTHYSVITGYSGDGDSFQLSDFTIMEVHGGAPVEKALKNLEQWMEGSGGTELNQLVIRQGGIGTISDDGSEETPNRGGSADRDDSASESQSRISISGEAHPAGIHKMGAGCLIKGSISSSKTLESVTARVTDTHGKNVLEKVVQPQGKNYELVNIDKDIAISGLRTGSYIYSVAAVDTAGYEKTLITVPFAVVEDIPSGVTASTLQSMNHVITLRIDAPVMYVNGQAADIDANGTTPVISGGSTLLPLRAVMESMGAEVKWYGDEGVVTVSMDGKELNLQIDKTQAWDNGEDNLYTLPTAPVIINDRTMLPIRFVAEYFGGTVAWSQSAQMVAIVYR